MSLIFQPAYWCGTKQNLSRDREGSAIGMESTDERADKFEPEPQNIQAGIQIRGLTKKFSKGFCRGADKEKVCVLKLKLKFYEVNLVVDDCFTLIRVSRKNILFITLQKQYEKEGCTGIVEIMTVSGSFVSCSAGLIKNAAVIKNYP